MPVRIRPKDIDPIKYMQQLFLSTEQKIIAEILRKRSLGYVDYAEVAALKRIQNTLKGLVDESFSYVPIAIEEIFYKTNKDLKGYANAGSLAGTGTTPSAKPVGLELGRIAGAAATSLERVLSPGQKKAIETITNNLLGEITEAAAGTYKSAEQLLTIGRLENDPFRSTVLSQVAELEASGKGSLTELVELTTRLNNKGLTAFVDKAGREWSLRDYGKMAVRTSMHQAQVAAVLTADDHDLYEIVKIGSTCPVCAPLEGRVYSKSGKSPYYPPLSMAFSKIDPHGSNDISNTYLNIHPNCLHSIVKFTEIGKTDKQLAKIREFSSPVSNPVTHDPRTKKQIEAYKEKVRNRQRLLRELRKKQAEQLLERDLDYMSNSFRPKYANSTTTLKTGNIDIKTKRVENSKFNLYADAEASRRDKAVRLVEKQLMDLNNKSAVTVEASKVVVIDFKKYGLNKNAIAGYDKKSNVLYYNNEYDTTEKILNYVNKTAGQFANKTEYAPVLHELGHCFYESSIKSISQSRKIAYNKAKDIIDSRISDYVHAKNNVNPNFLRKELSLYAEGEYATRKYTEVVAESYSVKDSNSTAKEIIDLLGGD